MVSLQRNTVEHPDQYGSIYLRSGYVFKLLIGIQAIGTALYNLKQDLQKIKNSTYIQDFTYFLLNSSF